MNKNIKEKLLESSVVKRKYITTGCSLLNLAVSDDVNKGYEAGTIVNIIGSTHAGKSLLAGTTLAEMCYNKKYDKYKLLYDDTENGFKFDITKNFGERTTKRIKFPYIDEFGDTRGSKSIMESHLAISKLIEKKKPFVAVIDSLDGLMSEESITYVEVNLKKFEENKKLEGSYNMTKQAYLSQQFFPHLVQEIFATDSLLLILSQQGKNITGFQQKNRAGGKSLKFYTGLTLWINPAQGSKIVKKHKKSGKDINVGLKVQVEISKNRISGKPRTINMTILHGYGVDDITTSLEWLKEWGYWEFLQEKIESTYSTLPKMVEYIESNNKEKELKQILQECWNEVEKEVEPNRKFKYKE